MRGFDADPDFLHRVRPRLARVAARWRIPSTDVEDLVQETLLVFLTNPTDVQNPTPWLFGILFKVCRRYWQARELHALKIEALRHLARGGTQLSHHPPLDVRLDLEALLGQLSPRERRCLAGRFLLDLDTEDLAAAQACHPTTVRRLIRTGLQQIALRWPGGRALLDRFD